jgi:hypothetical protein
MRLIRKESKLQMHANIAPGFLEIAPKRSSLVLLMGINGSHVDTTSERPGSRGNIPIMKLIGPPHYTDRSPLRSSLSVSAGLLVCRFPQDPSEGSRVSVGVTVRPAQPPWVNSKSALTGLIVGNNSSLVLWPGTCPRITHRKRNVLL